MGDGAAWVPVFTTVLNYYTTVLNYYLIVKISLFIELAHRHALRQIAWLIGVGAA